MEFQSISKTIIHLVVLAGIIVKQRTHWLTVSLVVDGGVVIIFIYLGNRREQLVSSNPACSPIRLLKILINHVLLITIPQ